MKSKPLLDFESTYADTSFATARPVAILERTDDLEGLVGDGEGACQA